MQKHELWSLTHTIIKTNSRWIIELTVKPKTIELSEENWGENLCGLGLGNNFLNTESASFWKNW